MALALCALGAAAPALADDDTAPLGEISPAPSRDPCAPLRRTSPEFLAAFAGIGSEVAEGAAGDVILTAFQPPPAPPGPASERILASAMLPTARTRHDAQWRRVRDVGLDRACAAAVLGAAPASPRETVAAVNRWVNRNVRYVDDAGDRWATAAATLAKRRGDCEDIALAKLQLLEAAGFDPRDLYLTLVRDLVRRRDHAVLVVNLDGGLWLLDNVTDQPLDARASHDYRPVLTYSADRKWLHGY